MTDNRSEVRNNAYGVKKKVNYLTKEQLEKINKEELVDTVIRLQAQNNQLRNIIVKRKCDSSIDADESDKCCAESSNDKKKKRSFDFSKCRKRHIFLKFLYLGWDYQGLVTQDDTNDTIEEYLFNALVKTCLIEDRQSSNYHRCGRTDKGVSSYAQVVSLDVRSKLSVCDGDKEDDNELPYCKMLNRILPEDIRVVSWCPVIDSCSSRFNCISRTYKYYFIKGQLNITAMTEAAHYLIGEHDFRNFCKMDVGNGVVKFIRSIKAASISKFSSVESDANKNGECDIYLFKITANSFLWHQIRCIMSILFLIGENKEIPNVVNELLDVDKYPRKPQYSLAHHLPLLLHDCQFDFEPKWRYDDEELNLIIQQLQKIWAINQIKASQIIEIISDIKKEGNIIDLPDFKTSGLIPGVHPAVYKPLLQRPVCESLESRIEHYLKKQRIEKKESYQTDDRSPLQPSKK